MNVIGIGPLPVGALLWKNQVSSVLTVACKATFGLWPGESSLIQGQQPLNSDDVYLEDDLNRSVQAPSDLVPFKARADVVLVGFAFAPRGEPVRSLVARLTVGDVDKAIEVCSDRTWTLDGALREGPRFARLALRYERAGGGPETTNPIGIHPDGPPDPLGTLPLPNLQPPGFTPSRRGEAITPIGFGPIGAAWPSRRDLLGRLGAPPERWDLTPIPADFDPSYFNCAPRDQQLERLREDERIVLENLNPQHPRLVTNLPGVRPRAFANRGAGLQEIAMAADTLWIDTGAGICTLTWRGYVENPSQSGSVIIAIEGPGMALPWAEVQEAARTGVAPSDESQTANLRQERESPSTKGYTSQTAAPQANAPTSAQPRKPIRSTVTDPPTIDGPALPGASARDASSSSYAGNEPRRGADALPFTRSGAEPPKRDDETRLTALRDAPAPGAASPAWLQGRPAAPAPQPVLAPQAPAPVLAPQAQAPVVAPPSAWPFAPTTPASAPSSIVAPPAPVSPQAPMLAPPPAVIAPPPVIASAPRSGPLEPSSPWASGAPIGAGAAIGASAAIAAPLPGIAPRGASGSSLHGSAASASDAAAAAEAAGDLSPRAPLPARSLPAPAAAALEKPVRSPPSDVLDLLWYDDAQLPRMRAWWEELVTDLDFEPSDPRRDMGAEDPEKAKGRHNVFGILSDGVAVDPSTIAKVITGAVNEKGRFTPPLTLMVGELRFPFDEVETLKATIVAVSPLIGTDKRLKETVDSMSELLKTPYLQGSTGVVEKLTRDLRAQFREANKALPATYLDGHVERLLLEQRRYAIRKVFGGEFIRALLSSPGADASSSSKGGGPAEGTVPVYLPKLLDQTLPMLVTMKVRIIAEAHLQQDPYDASPYALRGVALGRSYQLDGWSGGGSARGAGKNAGGGGEA